MLLGLLSIGEIFSELRGDYLLLSQDFCPTLDEVLIVVIIRHLLEAIDKVLLPFNFGLGLLVALFIMPV